jgi:hypothetical protein
MSLAETAMSCRDCGPRWPWLQIGVASAACPFCGSTDTACNPVPMSAKVREATDRTGEEES